jgi:hypothetical protein
VIPHEKQLIFMLFNMPLSGKQKWRKILKALPHSQVDFCCYFVVFNSKVVLYSEQGQKLFRCATSFDSDAGSSSSGSRKYSTKGRKVEFDGKVVAVLIPTKDEYIEHKLQNDLWYNKDEMKNMHEDAVSSVHAFLNCSGI